MSTLNKSDLISQKQSGKKYYFFIWENHAAVIYLNNFGISELNKICAGNITKFALIEIEEVTV